MGLISRVSSRTYRKKIMSTQTRSSPNQQTPSSGSATQTITSSNENRDTVPTLRLTAETSSSQPRRGIRWTEDTVDNEHLGRKSSKKCCIFHKPKADPRDSTSEESDSSDEDVNAYERLPKHQKRAMKKKKAHKHGAGCNH